MNKKKQYSPLCKIFHHIIDVIAYNNINLRRTWSSFIYEENNFCVIKIKISAILIYLFPTLINLLTYTGQFIRVSTSYGE